MSQVLGLIPDDGYTERGVILGVPGLYPRLSFSFRPMRIDERVEYFRLAEKLSGLPLRRTVADRLAAKVVEWDLKDAKGEAVPLSPASMLKLKARLFDRLFSVVCTEEAPDLEPGKADDDLDDDLRDQIAAAETGRTVAEVREGRQKKTS